MNTLLIPTQCHCPFGIDACPGPWHKTVKMPDGGLRTQSQASETKEELRAELEACYEHIRKLQAEIDLHNQRLHSIEQVVKLG